MKNMNKRGWIRIVEAFIAILLIMGVILIIINGQRGIVEMSGGVFDFQTGLLKEIQFNDTLRSSILSTSGEVEWEDFPQDLMDKVSDRTLPSLECVAKICSPESECVIPQQENISVYAESVLISSNLNTYKPRKLKLFCWEN